MKGALIIGGLIIIIGGVWFLQQPTTPVPSDVDVETTTTDDSAAVESDVTLESDSEETTITGEAEVEVDTETVTDDTADTADADTVKEFTVDSFNFGYSMDEIRVNEGDTVTITLTNSDGFHDWVVDEFGAATEKISDGETTTVTFVADTAGTYEYYCSVGNHRAQGMVGTLIVE